MAGPLGRNANGIALKRCVLGRKDIENVAFESTSVSTAWSIPPEAVLLHLLGKKISLEIRAALTRLLRIISLTNSMPVKLW